MGKKVYRKKKKAIEIVIYQKPVKYKKVSIATLFMFTGIFLLASVFYYLTFYFVVNTIFLKQVNTSSVALNTINSKSAKSSKQLAQLPLNLQYAILHKKKKTRSVKSSMQIAYNNNTQQDPIIWHGPRDKKEIALTFDADMTPVMVDWLHNGQIATYDDTRITDFLTQHQIKATFFLTGLWIQSYPSATQELADNPLFELENHSYSHPSMAGYCFDQPQVPTSDYPFEIEKTQSLLEQYTHQTPKYFRFPGGCYDQADLDLVKKEGLQIVHWDDVANDGFNNNEEQIVNNVLEEAQNGSIIVMHMGSPDSNVPQTANALPAIIDVLQKRGFQFVTVADLLNPPKLVAQISPKEYLTSLESFRTLSP